MTGVVSRVVSPPVNCACSLRTPPVHIRPLLMVPPRTPISPWALSGKGVGFRYCVAANSRAGTHCSRAVDVCRRAATPLGCAPVSHSGLLRAACAACAARVCRHR